MEESKTNMALQLSFPLGGVLTIDTYSTLDIQRNNKQIHINLTNNAHDLAFNSLYDEITELLGDYEEFALELRIDGDLARHVGMVANYYYNGSYEVLHLGKKIELVENVSVE